MSNPRALFLSNIGSDFCIQCHVLHSKCDITLYIYIYIYIYIYKFDDFPSSNFLPAGALWLTVTRKPAPCLGRARGSPWVSAEV